MRSPTIVGRAVARMVASSAESSMLTTMAAKARLRVVWVSEAGSSRARSASSPAAGDHGRHGRESRAPTAGIPPDEPGHCRQSSETVTVTSMLPLVALE